MSLECDKCKREIVTEGRHRENYFVENRRAAKGEVYEVAICTPCFYKDWREAEEKSWEKYGSG